MSVIRNLVVKISADTGNLQKGLVKAQKNVSGVAKGINSSFGAIASGVAVAAAGIAAAGAAIVAVARDTMPAYADSLEGETKLTTIMRQRMGASDSLVRSLMDLAGVEQTTGVVEDDAVIAGQQQLATFLHNADALKTLTPAMADLVAQQEGYKSTAEGATSVANLMGKVLDGNTSALKRVGISFTAAQEKALKTGNEMERAAMLAQVITNNVGNMNQALGNTTVGRVVQLTNAWGNLKEQVGQAFYSLVAAATPALMSVINMLSSAMEWVNAFVSALTGVQGGGAAASAGLDDMGSSAASAGTAAKKALAPFDQITTVGKNGVGGGGASIPSPGAGSGNAGAQSIFSNIDMTGVQKAVDTFNQLKDQLITYLKPAVDYLNGAFKKLGEVLGLGGNGDKILEFLGNAVWVMFKGVINNIVTAFSDMITAVSGVIEMLTGLIQGDPVKFFNGLKDAILGIWSLPVDGIANIIDMIGGLFGFDVGASKLVQGIKSKVLEFSFQTALDGIKKAWSAVGSWFTARWNDIKTAFASTKEWFKAVFDAAIKLIKYVFGPIVNFMSGVWTGIKKLFAPVVEWFKTLFTGVMTAIHTVVSPIAGWIGGIFSSGWSKIKTAFSAVSSFFSGVLSKVKGALSGVSGWLGSQFSAGWNKIKEAFAPALNFFSTLWNNIKSKFTDVGTAIGGAVGGAFKSVMNSIFSRIESIVNRFIDYINGAIDIIDSIPGVNIGRIGKISIPRLETGGIATSSVLANIGEHGREAVLPLENHTDWMDELAGRIGGQLAMAGGPQGDVLVYLDSHQIAARIERRRSRSSIMSNGRV